MKQANQSTFVEILYVFVEIIEGTPPFSAILIYIIKLNLV